MSFFLAPREPLLAFWITSACFRHTSVRFPCEFYYPYLGVRYFPSGLDSSSLPMGLLFKCRTIEKTRLQIYLVVFTLSLYDPHFSYHIRKGRVPIETLPELKSGFGVAFLGGILNKRHALRGGLGVRGEMLHTRYETGGSEAKTLQALRFAQFPHCPCSASDTFLRDTDDCFH